MILTISLVSLLLAMFPLVMFRRNLPLFCVRLPPLSPLENSPLPKVSVLIPARDEQAGIERCVAAALASHGAITEVVVLDDHSSDRTAELVQQLAAKDDRVRLVQAATLASGESLPHGWNGKQHACFQLAKLATHERMVFLDADVRLSPDAIAKMVEYQDLNAVDLLSAFPHQETGTWMEQWIIPMMHYILLGFCRCRGCGPALTRPTRRVADNSS